MRILFLSQLLPLPLDAGPKIRAYYVLRYLVESGHEVTLACFVRPDDREADVKQLASRCRAVETVTLRRSRLKDVRDGLRSLASTTPFLIRRDWAPAMASRVTRLIDSGSFDAVHADQLWMAPYAAVCDCVPLRILDEHNAVFLVPQRLAANRSNPLVRTLLGREASKLATFEREMFGRFSRVVWVSDDDRRAFPGLADASNGKHRTIPIAADPETRVPVARPHPFRVTFLGGIHWPPNAEGVRWFADHVWPRVAAAVPDGVFTVIGRGSLGRLARWSRMARVEVVGYVADEDLEHYLAETAAFIVPLHTGAGMRVKILDAWCWGLPVVSTSIGAEGLVIAPGENLLVADGDDEFADSLIRVLNDRALAERLTANGRATVEAYYDWRKVYRAWDEIYH